MRRVLRSILECDQEIAQENLIRNFLLLQDAVDKKQLELVRPEDQQIVRFARAYLRQHSEMPSLSSVTDHFQREGALEVVERLKGLPAEAPYARTNFFHLVRTIQQEQLDAKGIDLLRRTADIVVKGRQDKVTGEQQKGFDSALQYFMRESQALRIDEQTQIHADIRTEGELVKEEYRRAEADKASALGVLCGIPAIDEACGGVKRGELWIHAAFTGQLKTTFALNWSYNAITRYQKNVVYISLEMPREQVRRQVYVMHSANYRFQQMGFSSLDATKVQRGLLTPDEKDFYFNYVVDDFNNNPNYGILEVFHPDRQWNIRDVQAQLEIMEREFEVSMVVIDHGLLLAPNDRNKSYTVEMGSIVDDAKRMALTFNRNRGVPVVLLWQMSRTGLLEAAKHDGVYELTGLNWASNCEKTADVVTATYLGEGYREQQRTKFSHLKNRDNALFSPTEATIDFKCRKLMGLKPDLEGGYMPANQAGDRVDEEAAAIV